MVTSDRDVRQLKASVQSFQGALAAIASDIERAAASGGAAGLEQAKAKLEDIREQIGDLVSDQVERAEEMGETVKKSVADNPFTVIAAAFVAGVLASLLLSRR